MFTCRMVLPFNFKYMHLLPSVQSQLRVKHLRQLNICNSTLKCKIIFFEELVSNTEITFSFWYIYIFSNVLYIFKMFLQLQLNNWNKTKGASFLRCYRHTPMDPFRITTSSWTSVTQRFRIQTTVIPTGTISTSWYWKSLNYFCSMIETSNLV